MNNKKDESGRTMFHRAVMQGNLKKAKPLLKKGAWVNAKDNEGMTPLHHAIENKKFKMAQWLLANGADYQTGCEKWGETPLHLSVSKGNLDIVKILISKGADIEAKTKDYSKETPLLRSVEDFGSRGRFEIVKLLLISGASIEKKDSDGNTALLKAIQKNYPETKNEITKFLKLVKLLLHHHANIHARNNSGETALHIAATENISTVELLIKAGVDIMAKDSQGATALHHAINNKKIEVLKYLMPHYPNIDIPDNLGETPLFYAISKENQQAIECLIKQGASLNCRNRFGWAGHDHLLKTVVLEKFKNITSEQPVLLEQFAKTLNQFIHIQTSETLQLTLNILDELPNYYRENVNLFEISDSQQNEVSPLRLELITKFDADVCFMLMTEVQYLKSQISVQLLAQQLENKLDESGQSILEYLEAKKNISPKKYIRFLYVFLKMECLGKIKNKRMILALLWKYNADEFIKRFDRNVQGVNTALAEIIFEPPINENNELDSE
jgi:ankyrin repeat protein